MRVIFNPRCSKCRSLRGAFNACNIEWQQVLYLDGELTREVIDEIFDAYKGDWRDLLRTNEPAFKEHGVKAGDMTPEEAKALIAIHPVVLQRPVVLRDGEAFIARDDETVARLTDGGNSQSH